MNGSASVQVLKAASSEGAILSLLTSASHGPTHPNTETLESMESVCFGVSLFFLSVQVT